MFFLIDIPASFIDHLAVYVRFTMWTYMYHLRSILFMILRLVLCFFRIRTFTSEDNVNLSHNSFGYMYIMHQIYFILIGSFMVFICMYSIFSERMCVCVCARVCILLCKM